jgi:hypothetical protein
MDLATYVDKFRRELGAAAEAASAEVREAADRLSFAVEPSMRMALLDVLGDATDDITAKLEGAVVEVRLRGRDPEIVVTEHAPQPPAPPEPPFPPEPPLPPEPPEPLTGPEADEQSRISLRVPERLKAQIEQAADAAGQSVNSWLVRAAADQLSRGRTRQEETRDITSIRLPIGQRLSGWQR